MGLQFNIKRIMGLILLVFLILFVLMILTRLGVDCYNKKINKELLACDYLVENIITAVKYYAPEQDYFYNQARQSIAGYHASRSFNEAMVALVMWDSYVKSLFELAEQYQNLKMDSLFLKDTDELLSRQKKINKYLNMENYFIKVYNFSRSLFPVNLIAGAIRYNYLYEYLNFSERVRIYKRKSFR